MEKNKKILSYAVFWLIQCTWGIIMTLIGAIIALGLIITGHKPKLMGPALYFEIGENWGGINFGPFFLCCKNAGEDVKYHEFGHGLQNLIWGPLMPFIVTIPSIARYWLFNFKTPIQKSFYVVCLMVGGLALCTLGAWIFALIGGLKFIVIGFEILRFYVLILIIWLNRRELPKFMDEKQLPNYNDIWFEQQATVWGTRLLKKKED